MPYSLSIALAAAVIAWGLTPLARRLALRLGAIDIPDARRIHTTPMPRFGGLAIAAGVLMVAWIARLLPGPAAALDPRPLLGLTLASLPILTLGMADDRWSVSPWVKLSVQTCAALTLTLFGFGVPILTNPFGPSFETGLLSAPLTVLWVLTVTNAINLIDGLDGLASGVVAIACAALWLVGRLHGDFYVMFLASLVLGACVGFLRWNFPPAKVFMGDTGSQFLGLMLSALSLLENRKGTAAVTLLLPLVALGLPLADSTLAFARRMLSGAHVFRGDTGHIHHRFLDIGLNTRQALFALWTLCAVFGGLAVLLTWLPRVYAVLIATVAAVLLVLMLEVLHVARVRRTSREAIARRTPRRH
ncbi:MAG: MraY family glycosyltransferase [Candidatus Eisenbacteria bacterium]